MTLLALSLHGTPLPSASRTHPKTSKPPVDKPKPRPPEDKPSQDKPEQDDPPPEKEEHDREPRQQYREPPYLAVIRSNMSQIESCYSRARAWTPTLQGEVVVEFDITLGGSVEHAEVTSNTTGHGELASCILQAVKLWHFPYREGEHPDHVRHPFRFQPSP